MSSDEEYMLRPEARKFNGQAPRLRYAGRLPAGVPVPPDPDAPLPRGASGSPPAGRDARRVEMTAETRQRTDHAGTRRFSHGIERLPDTREKRALGSFSRGTEH